MISVFMSAYPQTPVEKKHRAEHEKGLELLSYGLKALYGLDALPVIGYSVLGMGISSVVLMQNMPAVVFSVVAGTMTGLILKIGDGIQSVAGNHSVLIAKSVLDFFTAMIFFCKIGKTVSLIGIPQFTILISLYLLSKVILPLTSESMILDFKACGGFLLLATAFRMLKLKNLPVADMIPAMVMPVSSEDVQGYFRLVTRPEGADAAVVFVESPLSDGYSQADLEAGGNGYLPISLQYRPYTADAAREHSIASGDAREDNCDRTYRGKTNTAWNEADLDAVLNAREAMGDRPVIVCLKLHNPAVVSEFEKSADGILAHFGVETKVLMEILSGDSNPGGRLPLILPECMETVEQHCEDVFDDIRCHVDECGNRYTFGFGLTYEK